MEHDARSVANQLIVRGIQDNNYLTPLAVIKLVYYCHAWTLVWHDKPLISQDVEAWQHGPVIADVYDSLKRYGRNQIGALINLPPEKYSDDEGKSINIVYDYYGDLDGLQLSTMTHRPGSPWDQVWSDRGKTSWRTWRKQASYPERTNQNLLRRA